MRIPSIEDLRRIALQVVQPLESGVIELAGSFTAKIKDVSGFGSGDQYKLTFPYGMVAKPVTGVVSYFVNLHGSVLAPIIVAYLDKKRPVPSTPGEVILYCQNADGTSVPIKLTLGVDGKLRVEADEIKLVKLGSADGSEPLVLGNVLKTLLGDVVVAIDGLSDQVNTLAGQLSTLSSSISVGPISIDTTTSTPEITSPTLVAALAPVIAQMVTIQAALASNKTDLLNKKSQFIDTASTNIVSQVAFTERGI
jgi:hypothetical protein